MLRSGLLVVTTPLHKLNALIPSILESVSNFVTQRLYIRLEPGLKTLWPFDNEHSLSNVMLYEPIVAKFYLNANKYCKGLDIEVLIGNLKKKKVGCQSVDVFLFDDLHEKLEVDNFLSNVLQHDPSSVKVVTLENLVNCEDFMPPQDDHRTFNHVAVGGTFDKLHNGHKLLLSEAVLRSTSALTVGIADGQLLKNKKLGELIDPCEARVNAVKKFLTEIDSSLDYNVVPITDTAGPAGTDPTIEMLLVTEETAKGGYFVNEERIKKGLKAVEVLQIPLVYDNWRKSDIEEEKISSSSLRMRMLGTLIKAPGFHPRLSSKPYTIGLTGGSCSGKSSIAAGLAKLGAGIVDCDKLGHQAYLPGTSLHSILVNEFGPEIEDKNGNINRKQLGNIVFRSKEALARLNNLVWPEIWQLAEKERDRLAGDGKIVIMDAAVLIEAGWDKHCHEVWVCIIPHDEAVRRMIERDNISQEVAECRLKSQLTNTERVKHANVIFSSFAATDYTLSQVKNAWTDLLARINQE